MLEQGNPLPTTENGEEGEAGRGKNTKVMQSAKRNLHDTMHIHDAVHTQFT